MALDKLENHSSEGKGKEKKKERRKKKRGEEKKAMVALLVFIIINGGFSRKKENCLTEFHLSGGNFFKIRQDLN